MTVRIAVAGATGRMGRTVLSLASERADCSVVLAIAPDPDVGTIAGVPVRPAARLVEGLDELDPDVLVEFTAPESTAEYAARCRERGVALVSGTTGLSDAQERRVGAAADRVPVVRAANFSRGAGVLERLLEVAADALPEYDLEVVETHHAGKRDAPSGTAVDLLSAADRARDADHRRIHGRRGESSHSGGSDGDPAVGVHSLRAGDVTGEHTVLLAGEGEQVRIEHRATDRRAFASGALDAAVGVAGRGPGRYDPEEVWS